MKIIGVIPARYASSRFPGKPLADICGMPMIWWVYQQALKAVGIDSVIVATDHLDIYTVCQHLGLNVIMTAEKHKSGVERLSEVASVLDADYYFLIQGDEPLIESDLVSELSELIQQNKENDSVVTFRTPIESPVDVVNSTIIKVITDVDNNMIFASRSAIPYPQNSVDFLYFKTVGIYSYPRSVALSYSNLRNSYLEKAEDHDLIRLLVNRINVKSYERKTDTISVDTPKDLRRIRDIINKKMED